MWYEDLSHCNYLGKGFGVFLTAVGWLEKGKDFSTGKLPKEVYLKLLDFHENYWMFVVLAGVHECDLCKGIYKYGTEITPKADTGIILIPGNGRIYAYPRLLIHYIKDHDYLPPKEFIDAVISCPSMKSKRYFAKLAVNGFVGGFRGVLRL